MLEYATYTDIGTREVNEDALGVTVRGDKLAFAVCDGLGGHSCGELASQTAIEAIAATLTEDSHASDFLTNALDAAQTRLLAVQNEIPAAKQMRTTAVLLFTDGKCLRYGHIGDSRLYAFPKGGARTRTVDHSIPQILALTGEIEESEIRFHPDRNRLLKALGNEGSAAAYELSEILPLSDYEAFLLCTDGFWEHISDEEMSETLAASASAAAWRDRVVKIVTANTAGKSADNRTAILVLNRD